MKTRHTLVLFLSTALLSSAPGLRAQAPSDLTAEQIVEKHLAALGGREALGKITTRHAAGTASISIPQGELSGPIEQYYKAPNKAHTSIQLDLSAVGAAGQLTIEQIFDGTNGWVLNSMQGDEPYAGRQLTAARNNHFPTPLINLKESGAGLKKLPNETVDGKSMLVIQFDPAEGEPVKVFIDPATFLIAQTETTVDNQASGGTMTQISRVSDYRAVDGVKVPFTVTNQSELQTVTVKFTKIENNVPVDDALFVKK